MAEIQSLARGLRILDCIAQSEHGVNLADIAELLAVDKSSASRLLSTLEHYGYVSRDVATRRYLIGTQVMTLCGSLLARFNLRDFARPFLNDLMEHTHESAILGTITNGQVIYMEMKNPRSPVNVTAEVGTLAPLHATALGKLALAYSNEMVFPAELPAYTPNTISNPETLRHEIRLIRAQGFALDREEYVPGVKCVGAPVFDYQNRMIGAIGLTSPAKRLNESHLQTLIQQVCGTAETISRQLGYQPSPPGEA